MGMQAYTRGGRWNQVQQTRTGSPLPPPPGLTRAAGKRGNRAEKKKEKKKEKEIVKFYALALYIYNNFDLCLSISLFFIYKVW